jgi:hypothetical protein
MEELGGILHSIGSAGNAEGLTLTQVQGSLRLLNRRIANLSRETSAYANERRTALKSIATSMEQGLEDLAVPGSTPEAFRETLKMANAQYLRQRTHEEMGDFLLKDMIKPLPNGAPGFDPVGALRALDNASNERMVGYMKKLIPEGGEGKTLYEMTKGMLTEMASTGATERETARQLAKTGGVTLGPKPQLEQLTPSTRPIPAPLPPMPGQPPIHSGPLATIAGPALGAGIGYMAGGAWGAGVGGGIGQFGGPQILTSLLMTPTGQNLLKTLVHHNGRELSPTMVGLLTAAGKSIIGELTD